MQLHLHVQGQIKTIPVNSCVDQQGAAICDQLKHFMIEVKAILFNLACK